MKLKIIFSYHLQKITKIAKVVGLLTPQKKIFSIFKFRNILLANPLSYHTKSQLINKENNLPSSFAEEEYEKLLDKEKSRNKKRKRRAHRRKLYRMCRWCFQKLYYWSMEENQKLQQVLKILVNN